jgi:hypothetical protein
MESEKLKKYEHIIWDWNGTLLDETRDRRWSLVARIPSNEQRATKYEICVAIFGSAG